MSRPAVIVRSDDPRRAGLEGEGYRVVGESWGARLRIRWDDDLDAARAALRAVHGTGIEVRELGPEWTDAVQELQRATNADYPVTPATPPPDASDDAVRALWGDGGRVFGALDGDELVAVTAATLHGAHAETGFTAVRSDRRRRGLASAVKAASVLRLHEEGAVVFATGGAAANAGSIRMNERLGYAVEERWLSYAAPDADG